MMVNLNQRSGLPFVPSIQVSNCEQIAVLRMIVWLEVNEARGVAAPSAIGCIVRSLKAFIETVAALFFGSPVTAQNVGVVEYPEMSDPSAAVAISDSLFIVASDEDNVLRVYARENFSTANSRSQFVFET